MTNYAFKIGQMVEYRPTTRLTGAVPGPYQIIQRMPTEDGEFKYRIKSPREPHERIAKESPEELTAGALDQRLNQPLFWKAASLRYSR